MPATVAVIDIGSNSIKVLVATRADAGSLRALAVHTLDARISTGISQAEPRLTENGMQRGVAAVQELLSLAASHHPTAISIVATSAVRGARNGDEFRARVRTATGHDVRVLSGDEEANLIGRGLTADPALRDLQDFYVFDLGGGSLECLAFRRRQMQQAQSLPLGCVRLTERFIEEPSLPVSAAALQAVHDHARQVLEQSNFRFDLEPAHAVFAGGTLTTARVVLGLRDGHALEETSAEVPVAALQSLLQQTAALPLDQRRQISGLPPARADVFPAALATAITVAELSGVDVFHHSLYNLRWGVAAELLQG